MGEYMAMRIIQGAQSYATVVSLRPDLKAAIDEALIKNNRGDLIVK